MIRSCFTNNFGVAGFLLSVRILHRPIGKSWQRVGALQQCECEAGFDGSMCHREVWVYQRFFDQCVNGSFRSIQVVQLCFPSFRFCRKRNASNLPNVAFMRLHDSLSGDPSSLRGWADDYATDIHFGRLLDRIKDASRYRFGRDCDCPQLPLDHSFRRLVGDAVAEVRGGHSR